MPFLTRLWVLAVLAFRPQAVLSALKFSFDHVEQCEPVSITFSQTGLSTASLPLTLTVLPITSALYSAPIVIPIPNAASTTSGVYFTFLPLAANTQFIASLDDASGDNVANISDVIRVHDSPSGNKTCLPETAAEVFYSLTNTFSQCEPFNVTYNTSVITRPPSVRTFVPKGNAFTQTGDITNGVSTYVMSVEHGKQMLLLVDDGISSHRQITTLLLVAGDTSSNKSCLNPDMVEIVSSPPPPTTSSPKLPRGAVIGISVGAASGLFVLITAMVLLLSGKHFRRRALLSRRERDELGYLPLPPPSSFTSHASSSPPASFPQPPRPVSFGQLLFTVTDPDRFVHRPPYPFDRSSLNFGSAPPSYHARTSTSSFDQAIPEASSPLPHASAGIAIGQKALNPLRRST